MVVIIRPPPQPVIIGPPGVLVIIGPLWGGDNRTPRRGCESGDNRTLFTVSGGDNRTPFGKSEVVIIGPYCGDDRTPCAVIIGPETTRVFGDDRTPLTYRNLYPFL